MEIPISRLHPPFVIPSNTPSRSGAATLLCCHQTMNHDRGRGQHPGRGRIHGPLPTTFDNTTNVFLFDYDIKISIRRDVLAMEEAKTSIGHPTLWNLEDLLAHELKERSKERLNAFG